MPSNWFGTNEASLPKNILDEVDRKSTPKDDSVYNPEDDVDEYDFDEEPKDLFDEMA